ncbi:MAG: dihydroorotase [Robiginitomaculum sp.]|nr:MAG: dihydroorotase [Robiginitomaculum sp.]
MSTHSPTQTPNRLVIRQPDDWHVHVRDGEMLNEVVNFTARQFARAIIMPNLANPVTTAEAAENYRTRILGALDTHMDTHLEFTPLMTCYLTDTIDPKEIEGGFTRGIFTACKLYPANATTNSSHGVTDIQNIYSVLETMQRIRMPLLVHGEVTDKHIDIFDREAVFIDRILSKIVADFPGLKIVFEHITTKDAVDFVQAGNAQIAATITPHHLVYNRSAIFEGGIRPHLYCLPIAKREVHRLALRAAATSGSPKFFLGTDSAPHTVENKQSGCGCAGVFNAPFAIESYAKTFEEEDALDKLEGFASEYGPQFYGLPLNPRKIILKRTEVEVPKTLKIMDTQIIPFHAEETLPWRFAGFED